LLIIEVKDNRSPACLFGGGGGSGYNLQYSESCRLGVGKVKGLFEVFEVFGFELISLLLYL